MRPPVLQNMLVSQFICFPVWLDVFQPGLPFGVVNLNCQTQKIQDWRPFAFFYSVAFQLLSSEKFAAGLRPSLRENWVKSASRESCCNFSEVCVCLSSSPLMLPHLQLVAGSVERERKKERERGRVRREMEREREGKGEGGRVRRESKEGE